MVSTSVTIPFADGVYNFALPMPRLCELERKTGNTSVVEIYERMTQCVGKTEEGVFVFIGGASVMGVEVIETIRCGLLGGNHGEVNGEFLEVGPIAAKNLVENYAYPSRPLKESIVVAWQILHAAIEGVQLEEGSKKKAAPKGKRSTKAKS